jgi:serine/threonine protein kinase
MDPNETRTQSSEESADPLEIGLAAAFGPRPSEGVTGTHRPAESPGTIIAGKYKLLQQIGEGGMGSVWMADQVEPVKRRIAVKLIRVERGSSKTILSRFEAERQAIALMDHPHIAKLLDAGTTENSQPYFVMELVKGIPLTDYCDQHKLPIPERLQLFLQICSAVQHAHQKGIIHRDLKPSNILVESHDGKPVPKVIDFGLAKATSGLQLTENTLFTGFGSVLGTPMYMAPEQANFNAIDVDTRADIYALGVILYELLTGTTPITRETIRKAQLDEMLKLIREQDAPTPSSRLSTSGTQPSVAANRQTEPVKLGRIVKGELDWIVMKSLSKERERRYETANGFAKDVERYLNHEPVHAGPVGAGYRIRKFVRRNRPQVVAASLLLVTLLAGVAGTTVSLIRANRAAEAERIARDAAEEQRAKALHSAEKEADERKKADAAKAEAQAKEAEANAVVKFFENQVFAAARPKGQGGGLGAGVTLRDAIAASIPAIEKGFTKQPLVEARLRTALGYTFYYLADYDLAREQFELARLLFCRNRGSDHPDTLRCMGNLGNIFSDLDRHNDALKIREETLAIQQRVLPSDHPDTLTSMNNLALSYARLNRHADALKLYEDTLAIQKRVLAPEHPDTLRSMNNLANSYADMNRHEDALRLREETLAIQKRVLPPDHPDTLASMSNLANSYAIAHRSAEALALREETLAIQKRVLPPDHPDTLRSMNNLANSYADLNRNTDALKLREATLSKRKRVLPTDHPETLASINNLALSYADHNRYAEALELFQETLEIRKRVLPKDHADTLKCMEHVAKSLIQLDRGSEAIPYLDEFIDKASTCLSMDPQLIPRAFGLRRKHFQKTSDPAGCRATAEMWEKLNRKTEVSFYNAACFRAVTASVQANIPGTDAIRLAKEDADKAMQWLHKAVQAGYKDVDHMKKDTDLDPLREREDFKKLIAELEKKAEKK